MGVQGAKPPGLTCSGPTPQSVTPFALRRLAAGGKAGYGCERLRSGLMQRSLLAVFLVLATGPAWAAGRNAPPPPSGIVVHLFGPNGVWSNIMPSGPAPSSGAVPAGTVSAAASAAAPPAAPPASGSVAPASAGAPAASAAYPEPTLGSVLHQMFITGDPDRGPGFSRGRQNSY